MKKNQFKGSLLLFIAALVWGSSFIAQAEGMELVEGFTFNAIRMLLGAVVLLPFILIGQIRAKNKPGFNAAEHKDGIKKSVISGAIIGVILFVASSLQQFALNYTGPGKVAFITAFYMFLVPIIGLIFGTKPHPLIWGSIVLGIGGLYVLCIGPAGFSGVSIGDLLALGGAICYSVHIVSIERLGAGKDGLILSCVQFAVTAVISFVLMFIFEKPDLSVIIDCAIPICYSGIMSCGVAFTFQVLGQKDTEPAIASLIMCLESVFAVLCECLFYKKLPTKWEGIGCGIMFAAIIISQIPGLREYSKSRRVTYSGEQTSTTEQI